MKWMSLDVVICLFGSFHNPALNYHFFLVDLLCDVPGCPFKTLLHGEDQSDPSLGLPQSFPDISENFKTVNGKILVNVLIMNVGGEGVKKRHHHQD